SVGVSVKRDIRISASRQKALKPDKVSTARLTYQYRTGTALIYQGDAPKYKGPHHDLPDIGRPNQSSKMRGVE
ncbi:hypothetical protein SB816_32890, partial [Achromobacter sp. SIMBA_011]|uniref:hypothetical protein n=1 Tax=Achromobacter sp. SIMBA_011 TaxID=3085759 RepID=UPI00397B101B